MLVCQSKSSHWSVGAIEKLMIALTAQAQAHPQLLHLFRMAEERANINVSYVWLINAPVQPYSAHMHLYLYNERV